MYVRKPEKGWDGMNLINKMERKFGKYAIHNLMYYVVILQIAGVILYSFAREFTVTYLMLDIGKVLEGQIWRLFTFAIIDISAGSLTNPMNILFLAITLYLYYMIGRSLENVWGAFKFNLYYLSGILLNIIAAFILYFVFKDVYWVGIYPYGLYYVNMSLFLTFACVFPDMELLYMFIIPLKMKWLGILYGLFIGKDIVECIYNALTTSGSDALYYGQAAAIVVALLNFIVLFLVSRRNYRRISPQRVMRKQQYKQQVRDAKSVTRHRCAVCGRTEQDDPMLEFRYCSKCDGNYEYCMEHLFTHEHVKKH